MGAFRNREHLNIPSLRFTVDGGQIQEALKVKNSELSKEIEELQVQINKICKDRGVDPKEVEEAGEDQDRHEGYMSKALSGANAPRHGVAVRELEKDLSQLKTAALRMSSLMWRIADFNRISKNLEKTRKFDLVYDELITLGFWVRAQEKIIAGLTILLKYIPKEGRQMGVEPGHDVIYSGPELSILEGKITAEDEKALEDAGWHKDSEGSCWAFFT